MGKVWYLLIKNPRWLSKKKISPKYKIELFSKATDEGNKKMSKVLTSNIEEYILKHVANEMLMEI